MQRLLDDRYRLVRALGRGGFGEVHLAFDEVEGREVAVKLIDRGSGDLDQLKRRLQREARATHVLDEARVARVERVGEAHGEQLYLVMPFVVGETVRERIQRGSLEIDEALRILREVATTLEAAHAAGLVHRDVKPDNVMLAAAGRVVLLDFGIVKALTETSESGGAAFASTQLTGSDALLGTLSYVAPEQALGNDIDARADQFGLAVMAFELLTGRLPWSGELPARILAQVLYQAPPRASALRPELRDAVDATFDRALAKPREARFASVVAFMDALDDAVRRGISPAAYTSGHAAVSAEGPLLVVGEKGAPVRRSGRKRGWQAALALCAIGVVWAAFAIEGRARAPVKWSSSARGTLAVPLATLDARAPCSDWLSGAIAEGLTSQLAAGGKTRAVGPRELGALAHATPENRKGLQTAFGADAVLETECARPGGEETALVHVRVTSASDDARVLASFEVSGSPRAPADLVSRVAEKVRERLGIEPLDAIERARAERTLPQSADASRAYVEGLSRLDAFDAVGARKALEATVLNEPQFAPAHAALARAFVYLGDQKNAARESQLAVQNASSLPNEDRLLVEADAEAITYAWDKAIETYRAIVRVFPDRTDVALKLIHTYVGAGRAKEARAAITDLRDRTGGDNGDPRLYLESARAASLAGESAKADELAQQAETVADAAGLTNVRLQATVVRCHVNAELVTDRGENICAEAERLSAAAGDRMGVLMARQSWAYVLAERADFDKAERVARSMGDLANEIDSPYARASALGMLATIAKRRGDFATAKEKALASVARADESGNGYARASTRIILAGILLDSGALEDGRKYYEEALVIGKEAGSDATTSVILQNLATYWLRKGNITLAREDAEQSLALCERVGNEMDLPWALDEVGSLEMESGETEKARDVFARAMAQRAKLKLPMGSSQQNHAESLMQLGQLDDALREISETVEENRSLGMRVGEEEARSVQTRILLARGEVAKALEACDAGLALAHDLKMGDDEYVAAHLRGLYLAGHAREALGAVKAALAHTSQPTTQWDLRLVEGELLLRSGQVDRGTGELRTLLAETHAAGDVRAEHAAAALLEGNLDAGYR